MGGLWVGWGEEAATENRRGGEAASALQVQTWSHEGVETRNATHPIGDFGVIDRGRFGRNWSQNRASGLHISF